MMIRGDNFHNSTEWANLSAGHKSIERAKGNYKCVDCGTTKHLESDHILPIRYKMFRLWLFNLTLRCGKEANSCNQKKSNKLYFRHWKTWLLLGIYWAMKLFMFGFGLLVGLFFVVTASLYFYVDATNGATVAGAVADMYLEFFKGFL